MKTKASYLMACAAALTLLASPALTQETLRFRELPNFHKVNDKLYRGAQPKTGGLQRLRELGIKTIVNLRDDDQRAKEEELSAQQLGFRYFNIPIGRPGRPRDQDIRRILSIIENPEHQPVLVHCKHGADRTGVVIATYRIVHDGWSSEKAKEEANRHGMKPWQFSMKDYIHDLYRDRLQLEQK